MALSDNRAAILQVLFGGRWLLVWDIVFIAMMLVGWVCHLPYLIAVGAVVVFTLYDLVGYEGVADSEDWMRNANHPGEAWDVAFYRLLASYRVTQLKFQLALAFLTATLSDWHYAVAWTLVWWFGGADVLYYWIGRYKMPKQVRDNQGKIIDTGLWTWVSWTPLGILTLVTDFLYQKFGNKVPWKEAFRTAQSAPLSTFMVLSQAFVGLLAGASSILYL